MILEMHDITGKQKPAIGHVAFPDGVTLGEIFDHDPKIRTVKRRIVKVQFNGASVTNWEGIKPRKHDKIIVTAEPGDMGILAVISAVISIVRFIMSLFNQPKSPKLQSSTPTYTFEGMRNTFTPGNVVQVVYGEHEVAGQVLMYYVDALDRKHEQFACLIGVSEGPIDSVRQIYINQIAANQIADAITDYRPGTTSQSIIPGFETIKNTFFDGREFTHDFTTSGSQSIVYPTVSNDVEEVDVQVLFPEGVGAMRTVGRRAGEIRFITVDYQIQYSPAGRGDWSVAGVKSNGGAARDPFIDNFHFKFPKPGAWDLEVLWLRSSRGVRSGIDMFRTVLQNVTEYRGPSGSFSSTALIAVKGVGSTKIQGGQPTITSLIRGMRPKVYTSPSSFYVAWTQNPAWCVLDYMTNSVYGLGPYVTQADIDIQSFIDFADLADSQTIICDDFSQACSKSADNDAAIFGNLRVYAAFAPGSPPNNTSRAVMPNPAQDPIRLISTAYSVSMQGLIICEQCCPHGDYPFVTGVRTPDHFCDRPEISAEFRGSSGAAVGGFALHVYSGSTYQGMTGYMLTYDQGRSTFSVTRNNSQSLATTGTVLGSAVRTMSPGNVVNFLVEPPDYSVQASGYYVVANHTLWASVADSWGGVFQDIIVGVRDDLPSSGGLNNDWGTRFAAVTLPVSTSYPSNVELGKPKYGGYNDLLWDEVTNVCGTCYCAPTFVDWGCDNGPIADCDAATTSVSALCSYICPYGQFAQIEYDGGNDVGGIAIRVPDDATSSDFTGLAALYVPDQTTVALYLYTHDPLNVEGSLLDFVLHTMNSGDTLKLTVASGQTEVYQTYTNSTLLITTNTIANILLDIFNPCITEIRSGSANPSPSGIVPTIATTYFPPEGAFPTAPTSYYQSNNRTFQVTNDFSFIADSSNNMADSVDLWLQSGSGGMATYGYKYVEGSDSSSGRSSGDYVEFAFHNFETTGSPITGVCFKTTGSGSSTADSISADNFTGYVVLNSLVTSELILGYYNHQSLVTLPPSNQILSVIPNSWMLTVPTGSGSRGMAMNIFASLPVSANPGAGWWDLQVWVGSHAGKRAFWINDGVNSATDFFVMSAVPWGAHINTSVSPNEFRFGEYRFDNTNFGLVVVGNSAAGVHAARWASNSSGANFAEATYSFIDNIFA